MREINLNVPLTGLDAFQVTLLATCETTQLILEKMLDKEQDRTLRERREYWLKRLGKALHALNLTFDGHVTTEFENRFKKYHSWIETDINSLLKHYGG